MTAFILTHRDLIALGFGVAAFVVVVAICVSLDNHYAARQAIKRRLGWWKR